MKTALLVDDVVDELPAPLTRTPQDLAGLVEELAAYHAHFAPLFQRREQRAWAAVYLRGLLTADVPRKNVEALALRLLGAGPGADRRVRALQQFIGEGAWDDDGLLTAHRRLVDETLRRGRRGAHHRRERHPQARHALGRGRAPVVRGDGEDRQRPGGRLPRRRQPAWLHAARPAALLSRSQLVHRGVPRAPAGVRHPGGDHLPDEDPARRRGGDHRPAGRRPPRALADLRRVVRAGPGLPGRRGGDGALVPGGGGARSPGLAAGRADHPRPARPAAALGPAARRLGQGTAAHPRAPAPRQPAAAAPGRPRRAVAPGRVAPLPHPRGEPRAAGGGLRRAGAPAPRAMACPARRSGCCCAARSPTTRRPR